MDITEYISFVYLGEEPDSPFQYVTVEPKEFYEHNHAALKTEVAMFYKLKALPALGIEAVKPSLIYPFLDYHLEKYKGELIDFIYMVKDINGILNNAGFDDFRPLWLGNEGLKQALAEWIQEKKAEKKARQDAATEIDRRIQVKAPKKAIKKYFMDAFVNTKDKNGVPYFSEEEVKYFLHANFTDFNPKVEIRKMKSKAFQAQVYIRRAVRAFYTEHTTGNTEKRRYCEMIRDNFSDFDNCDYEQTIVKNFSR